MPNEAKANAAISEAILQQFGGKHDPGWAHTQDKLLDAARHDHPWLSFQGHSLCVSFPVHRGEWATGQTGALVSLLHDIAQAAPPPTPGQDPQAKPADPEPWAQLLGHIQWLSAAPISYSTTDGQVTLRLGDSAQPSVFRLFVRDAYNPQLEATVTSAVPADLDEAIGRRLLQRGSDPAPPGIDAILAWGPPEAQVQGLAAVARGQDPAAAAAAIAKLEEFAATWNKTQGYPPAPEPWADPKQYLFQWRHWGKLMDNYPLSEEHKPLDAPASQPAH